MSLQNVFGDLALDATVQAVVDALAGSLTVNSELTTADLDTGAGTDTRAVVGIALAASGGAALLGTANPMPISDNGGSITVDDGGSTLSIDDGGGTITVDGTVGISGSVDTELTTADLDTGGGTDTRAVVGLALAASGGAALVGTANPMPISDNSGSITIDAPAIPSTAGAKTSAASLGVVLASDQAALPITDNGSSITVDNGGTFTVQDTQVIADNAGFTDGASKVFPSGYIYDEVAGTSLTENDVAAARIDAKRAQVLTLEDGTTRGRYATVTAANAVKVDASSVAVPVTDNGSSITVDNGGTFVVQDNQVVADNGNFTDGTSKLFMSGYIYDEVAGTALTENDAAAGRINLNRAVVSTIEDGATRGRYATVSAANALKVDGSAVTQPVSGTVTANIGTSGSLALNATIVSTNTKLDDILTELNQKLETGGQVALDSATLSALETITASVSNFPADFPDSAVLAKLELIRLLLAGTLTVSGTVAVTSADITSIKTAVELIDNAISGSEMQVDIVASLPAGTNAIGKLAANSGVDIGDVTINNATLDVVDVGCTEIIQVFHTSTTSNADGSLFSIVSGYSTVTVYIPNVVPFDADVVFEGASSFGTNWVPIVMEDTNGEYPPSNTTSRSGIYRGNCAGLSTFRCRVANYKSGSITAYGHATPRSFTSIAIPQETATITADGAMKVELSGETSLTPIFDTGGAPLEVYGRVESEYRRVSASAITSVASSTTSAILVPSVARRMGLTIYNNSTAYLYLTLGPVTTTSLFTVQIPPSGYYELPGPPFYSGDISGLWASVNGTALVTQLS